MIENTLGSKRLYKVFLSIIKYVPNILALLKIIGLVLSYFKMNAFVLTCFGGTSVTLLVILYLISYIFRFCGLYRVSLNYVTTITGISIIDYYWTIPLSMLGIYELYAFITGVFLTLWVWFFYKNRNNPKIDHIKQLCDRYICR